MRYLITITVFLAISIATFGQTKITNTATASYQDNSTSFESQSNVIVTTIKPHVMTANEFNQKYAIGTAVTYHPVLSGNFIETHTRSTAWELPLGTVVLEIHGKDGAVELASLEVYLTDAEIAASYQPFVIEELNLQRRFIVVVFPHDDPEQERTVTDNFMIYDDGKIAFDNWYPEAVSKAMMEAIREKIAES